MILRFIESIDYLDKYRDLSLVPNYDFTYKNRPKENKIITSGCQERN